jgi:hypothetical protein
LNNQNYSFSLTGKNNKKMKAVVFVVVLLVILVLIGLLRKGSEGYTPYSHLRSPYNAPDGMGACEFSVDCLDRTAGWSTMSNGMEGVCTLGGILCPAFSKDHYDEMKRLGII